jgi:hypothetical protein
VATQSGKLWDVDLESGRAGRQVTLPMRLSAPPGLSQVRRLYQVGDHSNLYVLDEQRFECREVYYLAHRPGTVAVPPVMALGYLFVAVNTGRDFCHLHVLRTDENGQSLAPARAPIRLAGRVTTPLLQAGARVLVMTDLGALRMLEVNPANEKEPVIDVVRPVGQTFKTPLDSFPVLDGGRLWVGSDRLTRYEIQTSRNQLSSEGIHFQRDTFIAPPQVLGDAVYHIRRRRGSPAFTVAASEAGSGQLFWETDLAVPAALLHVDPDSRQIGAVSMQAEFFQVTPEILKEGKQDQIAGAALGAARTVPFDQAIELDGDRWALVSSEQRNRIVLFNPGATSSASRLEMRPIRPASDAAVTTAPVRFQDGLLVPLDNGQVVLVDPQTGDQQILPFQAPVAGGTKTLWRRPAVTDDAHAVLADSQGKVYRVGIRQEPQPHLEAVLQADLGNPIDSALAVAGDTVYAVIREPTHDTVVSMAAGDLSVGSNWPLEGRVVWGPEQVGACVLMATDLGQLLCFESGGKQRWTTQLTYGPLTGVPLVHEGHLLLASTSGMVWRVSTADGSETARAEIGEPLRAGPLIFGSQNLLLLGGSDGTLHLIPSLEN